MIHVISLARTPERFAQFKRENPRLDIELFPAVDGTTIEPVSPYSRSATGCALSHRALWERAPLTVAEDDALFHLDFPEVSAELLAGLKYDIVMWGFNFDMPLLIDTPTSPALLKHDQDVMRDRQATYRSTPIRPSLYRLHQAFGCPAYTISKSGAEKMLQAWPPVDGYLHVVGVQGMVQNEGIDVVMCSLYPSLTAYVCYQPLVLTRNDKTRSTVQFC